MLLKKRTLFSKIPAVSAHESKSGSCSSELSLQALTRSGQLDMCTEQCSLFLCCAVVQLHCSSSQPNSQLSCVPLLVGGSEEPCQWINMPCADPHHQWAKTRWLGHGYGASSSPHRRCTSNCGSSRFHKWGVKWSAPPGNRTPHARHQDTACGAMH